MTTSRKLKIWTIITHALIVVGFGHGILFFGLIEILFFHYITKEHLDFSLNADFGSHLPVIGLITFLGQLALLLSILKKKNNFKILLQIIGLGFLWLSIMYFILDAGKDNYIHFGTLTCIPFVICTTITFFGQFFKRTYYWVVD